MEQGSVRQQRLQQGTPCDAPASSPPPAFLSRPPGRGAGAQLDSPRLDWVGPTSSGSSGPWYLALLVCPVPLDPPSSSRPQALPHWTLMSSLVGFPAPP